MNFEANVELDIGIQIASCWGPLRVWRQIPWPPEERDLWLETTDSLWRFLQFLNKNNAF